MVCGCVGKGKGKEGSWEGRGVLVLDLDMYQLINKEETKGCTWG